MNWEKFTWLVSEQRLWMTWLPMLEDKYEGKTPIIVSEEFQQALSNAKTDADRTVINANIDKMRRFATAFYDNYYVSCWTMNETESDLMWRSYTSSTNAVAIQTTCEIVKNSIPKYLDVGLVRYIDYKTQGFSNFNIFEWPMHKRLQFVDDREVRILATGNIPAEAGGDELRACIFYRQSGTSRVRICAPQIEPSALIGAMRLHPSSTELFARGAAQYCRDHGIIEPEQSELTGAGTF